jgi:hypothetical protein
VCYAFLDDVLIDSSTKEDLRSSSFSRSASFTWGWTLQEVIAPPHVMFFDGSWSFLGSKSDESLSPVIESVTGIDSIVLSIPATTKLISISKKLSWAARRKTTRIEDRAYSLMGILDDERLEGLCQLWFVYLRHIYLAFPKVCIHAPLVWRG